ncbi:MAG: GtrA family protein [Deltaproteobacteria bacterium]|nr:GtrA family protein [Deltaproteobacteria bacterium]
MHDILEMVQGHLSATARVWTAMAPALLLSLYCLVGLAIYMVRYAIKGPYRDPEFEARGSSVLANMWVRLYFAWLMQPLWRVVLRSGVPPTAITTLSALVAIAAGLSLAAGRFALGGWLYIFSGILDILDGRLARKANKVTKSGGALDSILDRYADSAVLAGLAWYYRDSWVLGAALVALIGSNLVPYIRARGEAAGVSVKEVGVMQRAERIIYIGVGCAVSPVVEVLLRDPADPRPLHLAAVLGVILLAVGTQVTALHRLVYVLAALDGRTGIGASPDTRDRDRHSLVAATVATVTDFGLMVGLVAIYELTPAAATAIGCVLGGITNLSIHLLWSASGRESRLPEVRRYAFVSFTSALLNAGGVWVLLALPGVDYRIAWVLVRTAVALAWNFPLHRDYVFVARAKVEAGAEAVRG